MNSVEVRPNSGFGLQRHIWIGDVQEEPVYARLGVYILSLAPVPKSEHWFALIWILESQSSGYFSGLFGVSCRSRA